MKQKIAKNYKFDSLGFTIILKNVPLVEIRGDLVPDINYNTLQKAVLLHLCHKKTPLTGNEIKFIRKYFALTTKDFGYLFGYTHPAVLKWEKQGDQISRMTPTTEFYLRLYIFEYLELGNSEFKELYNEISIPQLASYQKKSSLKTHPVSIDVEKDFLSVA